ncbi:Hydroxyproline-rich glycoprotein family protein [Quillaja saponaria]|uniref:Hydroxyproline-rich glycoprotein family protein n=1 Tax=Quillaja saponaria TaxID=32244 RepID=A0AAD7PK03_QUISA|nr:Hydroxyproline-rich glycoprotein family protein [Quillaja saponaria]
MRGRSSSNQGTKEGMELDKLGKIKEEPHLSGAYIRRLVKQLSSSRRKDTMNPKDPDSVDSDNYPGRSLKEHGKVFGEAQQTQQATQLKPHKKQVRRRLHTSRPYQERLLNMAEARREIVTALKFHRAAMKQASEQQQQQPQERQQQSPLSLQPSHLPCFEKDGRIKSRRNPRIYPSSTTNFSNYMDNFSYSSLPSPSHPAPNHFSWTAASPVAPPLLVENSNFILPNQTLGLNLNFHDFYNLDATLYHNSNNTSLYSSSSPSSYSSPPLSVSTDQDVPSAAISQGEVFPALADAINSSTATQGTGGSHAAMDDDEMAEIRSIGEQYQMEWNDTMNLVTSARWFKFLRTMELGGHEVTAEDNDGYHLFDEVMEFPAWLNANESCLEQCSEDYYQDPPLPCMDIGDIEGMDGEWLA